MVINNLYDQHPKYCSDYFQETKWDFAQVTCEERGKS